MRRPCWRAIGRRLARPLWPLLRGGLRTQVVATVGLAPLTMLFFQQVSVVGFVANLFAIRSSPCSSRAGPAGLLLPLLWAPAGRWCRAERRAAVAGAWPLALWTAARRRVGGGGGPAGAALAVLRCPGACARCAAVDVAAAVAAVERPAEGQFELVAADIARATRCWWHAPAPAAVRRRPLYSPESDAAGRVLLPLLRRRGEPASTC